MTSAINPNNVDGTYPVAGQDNSSQGFRDNFTNIKTNFTYAGDEITDLQAKVVLKAALTGTALDNDMAGVVLSNAQLQDMAYTKVALGALSGSVGINYAAGHFHTVTTSGSITLAFTNFPTSGLNAVVRVTVAVASVAHTLTLPAAVTLGITGIQGISSNVITFAATGTYAFEFTTSDAGATITIEDLNRSLLGSTESAVGYSTGTGGTVTQATSKSTGATLNKRCGQITMNNAALAAAAEVSFTLTNSVIAATDVVYACAASGATAGAYTVQCDAVAAGSCRISVGNRSAGSLSEAIVLTFVVIKAVSA